MSAYRERNERQALDREWELFRQTEARLRAREAALDGRTPDVSAMKAEIDLALSSLPEGRRPVDPRVAASLACYALLMVFLTLAFAWASCRDAGAL